MYFHIWQNNFLTTCFYFFNVLVQNFKTKFITSFVDILKVNDSIRSRHGDNEIFVPKIIVNLGINIYFFIFEVDTEICRIEKWK